MIYVTVNADDFGMNLNCTQAIKDAFVGGDIDSASLMVNMPCCEDAVQWAHDNKMASRIGLHLCFTEGVPLTDRIKRCPLICNSDGRFNGEFHWFRGKLPRKTHFILPKETCVALAEEAEAQIKRYKSFGLSCHFDSHHHSHVDWALSKIIFPIAESYGFKTARICVNASYYRLGLSRIYKRVNRWYMKRHGFRMVDWMGGIDDIRKFWPKFRNDDRVEIMVHPMYMKDGRLDMSGDFIDSGIHPMAYVHEVLDEHRDQVCRFCYTELESMA